MRQAPEIDRALVNDLSLSNTRQAREGLSARYLAIEDLHQRQEFINEIFPTERREELINQSSLDKHGRTVRYYRAVSHSKFAELLKDGSIKPWAHYHLDEKIADSTMVGFLYRHLKTKTPEVLELLKSAQEDCDLDAKRLKAVIIQTFPDASENTVDNLVRHKNYESMLQLVNENMSEEQIKMMHTGSLYMNFSSYLGVSIGGVMPHYLRSGRFVYLELVISDLDIIHHVNAVEGEKELFCREISIEQVSRAYIDSEQVTEEILNDERLPIAQWAKDKRNCGEPVTSIDSADDWRWEVFLVDCVPTSLCKRYSIDGKSDAETS